MRKRLEWKVGLFVLIALALLATLMIQFSKGMSLFRSTYTIQLESQNVAGLKDNAAVLMSGVQVGTVSGIRLAPDGKSVRVALRIYSEYTVHKDARFVFEQSGFLGDQYVAIVPTANQAPIFRSGDVALAEAPFNLQQFTRSATGFVQRVDDTLSKLNAAMDDVVRLVLNEQTLTNLALMVGNLRIASEQATGLVQRVSLLVRTNETAFSASVTNLAVFSERMRQLSTDLNSLFAGQTNQIVAALRNVRESSESFHQVMRDLESGQGTIGKLLQNDQMATDVSRIVQNLSITSSNLNRLGLWGILWKRKPEREEPAPPPPPLVAPKFEE